MKSIKIAIMAIAMAVTISNLPSSEAVAASHEQHASVMVKNAWARARTATAKVGGAFMTIHNMGKTDDRLISANSTISERTEIHTTEMTDGVMRMLKVKDGLEVKAGQMVELKPGSFHIMFLGLKEAVTEGKEFSVTLVFEKAGDVKVMVSVKKAGAMGGMEHGKMEHGNKSHEKMKKMN